MDLSAQDTAKLLSDVGEIKGVLAGIGELIKANQISTNSRIDDLNTAITRRLDSQDVAIGRAQTSADDAKALAIKAHSRMDVFVPRLHKTTLATGSAAGGLIAAGIELAKLLLAAKP